MPGKGLNQVQESETSPQRLVNAVISIWEADGAGGISARAVAGVAGLQVSSIYYHFGDLERLLESAQDVARAAAARWCEAQIDAIRGSVGGSAALGALLAVLIDEWCEAQRPLAFAWRECQLMALRDPAHIASCAKWDALWERFWHEICFRLGAPDMATSTAWVFEGAGGLHLLRWRRAVDRAALCEFCGGWARWLDGHLADSAPWFDLAREEASALLPPPPPEDPTADAIAEAAAATIARRGIAALTHRAVAAEAGVTLGVVSYKFRTSADLLRAAFESIYRRLAPLAVMDQFSTTTTSRGEALALLDEGVPPRSDLLASDELMVASARDPAFGAFAAQLRYSRGRSSGRILKALLGADRPIAPIDAAIFSSLLSGRVRAYLCGGRTLIPGTPTNDLQPLLARLG